MTKTPLDKIDEIHAMLTLLTQRMSLLENNVAMLNSKANGELIKAVKAHIPGEQVMPASPSQDSVRPAAKPPKKISKGSTQPRRNAKAFGTIVSGTGKRLADVTVKILNNKGEEVKATTTNRAGLWQAFLPAGKYSAEYVKVGLAPQYRIFEIEDGMKELEVT